MLQIPYYINTYIVKTLYWHHGTMSNYQLAANPHMVPDLGWGGGGVTMISTLRMEVLTLIL